MIEGAIRSAASAVRAGEQLAVLLVGAGAAACMTLRALLQRAASSVHPCTRLREREGGRAALARRWRPVERLAREKTPRGRETEREIDEILTLESMSAHALLSTAAAPLAIRNDEACVSSPLLLPRSHKTRAISLSSLPWRLYPSCKRCKSRLWSDSTSRRPVAPEENDSIASDRPPQAASFHRLVLGLQVSMSGWKKIPSSSNGNKGRENGAVC